MTDAHACHTLQCAPSLLTRNTPMHNGVLPSRCVILYRTTVQLYFLTAVLYSPGPATLSRSPDRDVRSTLSWRTQRVWVSMPSVHAPSYGTPHTATAT